MSEEEFARFVFEMLERHEDVALPHDYVALDSLRIVGGKIGVEVEGERFSLSIESENERE